MKDRIATLMKHLGMSQKVFASEICISEGALSSIFSGRTKPTLNTVNNIHERFPEVNMGWLIDGKGEMFVSSPSSAFPPAADAGQDAPATRQVAAPYATPGFAEAIPGALHTPSPQPFMQQPAKNLDKPARRITEIRVFYDDGTFETFPAKA